MKVGQILSLVTLEKTFSFNILLLKFNVKIIHIQKKNINKLLFRRRGHLGTVGGSHGWIVKKASPSLSISCGSHGWIVKRASPSSLLIICGSCSFPLALNESGPNPIINCTIEDLFFQHSTVRV